MCIRMYIYKCSRNFGPAVENVNSRNRGVGERAVARRLFAFRFHGLETVSGR